MQNLDLEMKLSPQLITGLGGSAATAAITVPATYYSPKSVSPELMTYERSVEKLAEAMERRIDMIRERNSQCYESLFQKKYFMGNGCKYSYTKNSASYGSPETYSETYSYWDY